MSLDGVQSTAENGPQPSCPALPVPSSPKNLGELFFAPPLCHFVAAPLPVR
jgi:hypothetical protein